MTTPDRPAAGRTSSPPSPAPGAALLPAPDTAGRLLDAAHALLYERPDSSVPVAEICARAEVNVAMVKYCFGNKAGLFDALLEQVVRTLVADLESLDGQALSAEEKLRLHMRAVVRNYIRFPYLNRLLNERFVAGKEDAVERLSLLFALPVRDWYARLLAEGRDAGTFREIDATFFFFSVLGAAEFMFSAHHWMERAFGETIDDGLLERFTDHLAELVLFGIARTSQAG